MNAPGTDKWTWVCPDALGAIRPPGAADGGTSGLWLAGWADSGMPARSGAADLAAAGRGAVSSPDGWGPCTVTMPVPPMAAPASAVALGSGAAAGQRASVASKTMSFTAMSPLAQFGRYAD